MGEGGLLSDSDELCWKIAAALAMVSATGTSDKVIGVDAAMKARWYWLSRLAPAWGCSVCCGCTSVG